MVACPTCGGELEYIAQYDRYYCYTCKKYAPKEMGKAAEPAAAVSIPCPTCGRDLTYIPEYDRYYCYSCNKYAPKGAEKQQQAEQKPPEAKFCPNCGKPLTYVEDYQRWYCYACKKYAPKEEKPPEVAVTAPSLAPEEKPVTEVPPAAVPAEVPAHKVAIVGGAPVEKPKEEIPPAAAPTPEPATPEQAPTPPVTEAPAEEKPPLDKKTIETGKKSYLVSLCQAYGLESSGNRAVLKQRLLDHMAARGLIPKEEEEEEGVPAEVATIVTEKPPEVVVTPEKPVEAPAAEEKPPEVPVPVIIPPVAEKPPEAAPVPEKAVEAPTPAAAAPEAPPAEAVAEKPPEAAPALEAPAPSPKLIVVKAISPCPTCGRELTFIKSYNRYYCYNCRKYAPEEAKAAPPKPAPAKPVAPVPVAARPAVRAAREAKPCPTCGGALSYIRQYNKWYCYSCRKYAPEKAPDSCPTCGGPLEYVAQYERYYCYSCKKYAPEKAVQAAPAAAAQVVRMERAGAVAPVHTHGGIGAGVGLAVVALVMFMVLQVLFYIPTLPGSYTIALSADTALYIFFLLQFLFGLFLVLAVMIGLVGLRKRVKKP